MTAGSGARSGGFALVAAVAALAFIEIVAIGLIALTTRSRVSVEEYGSHSTARIAAESAVRVAVAAWDERAVAFPRPGSRFAVPWAAGALPGGLQYAVEAERLERGRLLVRGTAWSGTSGTGVRASALATVTSIPSDEPRLDFHSALVVGGDFSLLAGAVADGSSPSSAPAPLQPSDCIDPGPASPLPAGWHRPGVALGTGATLVQAPGSAVMGSPGVLNNSPRAAGAAFGSFGAVGLSDLAAIADRIETGTITLAPRTTGAACDTVASGNWGAPSNRSHPCFDWLPFVFAPGGLTIAGGEGQGILIVDGNLTIVAGVRFRGAILVTGRFDAAAATVDGAVRVGGRGSRSAAVIRFDECSLNRAFTLSPLMRKVYRVADRWWLAAW